MSSNAESPPAAQCRSTGCHGRARRTIPREAAEKGDGRAEDTLAGPVSTAPTITIDALLDRYDAILFDAYGVLVHGSGAMPGAAELLDRLNREGRPYFIVTNDASKLPATAAAATSASGCPSTPTAS